MNHSILYVIFEKHASNHISLKSVQSGDHYYLEFMQHATTASFQRNVNIHFPEKKKKKKKRENLSLMLIFLLSAQHSLKFSVDNILTIFDISCKLFPVKTVFMKYQSVNSDF